MGDDIVLGSRLYMQNQITGEISQLDSITSCKLEPQPMPDPPKEIRGELTMTLEGGKAIIKMLKEALEDPFKTVSKKRCKKLLMSYGIPRNDAEIYSSFLGNCGMRTVGAIKNIVRIKEFKEVRHEKR